jgi:chaperone required for assembly of F1-ATPase
MKRFYKEAAVDTADGGPQTGYRVLLDGKPMRTPAKTVLVVPTPGLAEAIAAEWRGVPDAGEINAVLLPLTRLAATGLDRVTVQRQRVIEDTAKYAGSDLLCYHATGPESLVARQQATWQPLLDWAAQACGARLAVTTGTIFITQPAEAVAALHAAVATHSDLALSALYNLTHLSGSVVIALALSERHISAEEAFAAAQLDEVYQLERWGEDPTSTARHAGIARALEAGARFLALLEDQRLGK